MKPRTKLLLLAAIIIAGLAFFCLRKSEPSYQGKSLSEWLEQERKNNKVYSDLTLSEFSEETTAALQKMGTNAIPYLLTRIGRKTSTFKKGTSDDNTILLDKHVKLYEVQLPAAYAFKVFGAEAKNAIPSLTILLNDEETGEAAAVALTFIGAEAMPTLTNALSSTNLIMVRSVTSGLRVGGTNAVQAIPLLLINSTNADSKIRACSILVLGEIRFMPSTTLPRIIEALSDQDPFVRRTAIKAVGKYSANAAQTLPKLVELTADPDPRTQYSAFISIIQIEGVNGFPRYIDWLASFDATIRENANWHLKEFGRTNLTVRIALTNAWESTNENIRIGATNVLKRIVQQALFERLSP